MSNILDTIAPAELTLPNAGQQTRITVRCPHLWRTGFIPGSIDGRDRRRAEVLRPAADRLNSNRGQPAVQQRYQGAATAHRLMAKAPSRGRRLGSRSPRTSETIRSASNASA
jgi:hypothetical protein